MSQLRVYRDGKPAWQPEGPAYARRQGHGGAAMGTYHTGIVLVHDLRAVRRKALRRQAAPRQAARKAVAG